MLYHSHLQVDSTESDLQQAQVSAAAEVVPTTTEATGKRQSRGRGRASKQQQQQQQKQEQSDVVQQMIASMADVDPGFRGIKAMLVVQADGSAASAAVRNVGQQDGQQLGSKEQQESQSQQEQASRLQGQQQEPRQQQLAAHQQQRQEQQQQQRVDQYPELLVDAQHEQQAVQPESVDVDVEACSPQQLGRQRQIASVDLTCQSPTAPQAQAARAAGTGADVHNGQTTPADVLPAAAAGHVGNGSADSVVSFALQVGIMVVDLIGVCIV